jgi:hypothetical protein
MHAMTRPVRSSKVLLVADRREGSADAGAPVRRYRLARLRFDERRSEPESRFAHLKRTYD